MEFSKNSPILIPGSPANLPQSRRGVSFWRLLQAFWFWFTLGRQAGAGLFWASISVCGTGNWNWARKKRRKTSCCCGLRCREKQGEKGVKRAGTNPGVGGIFACSIPFVSTVCGGNCSGLCGWGNGKRTACNRNCGTFVVCLWQGLENGKKGIPQLFHFHSIPHHSPLWRSPLDY